MINPSNPCGSTFSKEHMLEIIKVADEFKLPIVADEVYYGLVYGEDSEFHSFGNLTKDVPIIVKIIFILYNIFHSVVVLFQKFIAYQAGE